MTEATAIEAPPRSSARSVFARLEVDTRLLGMVSALIILWIVFNVMSGGLFLSPRNLWNLSVQSAAVAIMTSGMVLIIVSRNIDLSIGSIVGFTAMVMGLAQTEWIPNVLGPGFDPTFLWIAVVLFGVVVGAVIGGAQGYLVAYIGIPSFIVTLGGLLSIRGLVWFQSQGAAVTGLDPTFQLIGGGAQGSVGGTITWILGVIGCVAVIGLLVNGRRQRRRYGFPLRPMWAEVLLGVVGSAASLGLAWYANNYFWPEGLANRIAAEQNWGPAPAGGWQIPAGFPFPIVLLIGVTLAMSFIANRRRFGRYVYAYGGNPDAAELAGINTRWTILKTYVVMGILCALAAAIASARLNGATLDIGVSYELYVIAAAVVGGTSFAGGIGTIPGAILGALVLQSLAYGLSFMGFASPIQNIVIAVVLVVAVGLDSYNRRRGS